MMEDRSSIAEAPPLCRRVLGRYGGSSGGPLVIVMSGIHGNEPAGVRAAQLVLAGLDRERPAMRGEFVAFAGNLEALRCKTRFVDKDLNRIWSPSHLDRLRTAEENTVEDREQRELLEALTGLVESAAGPVYFLDLHTSSAEGPPFLTIGDTLRNRSFALKYPLPVILGLEEQVDGALLEYMNNGGVNTMGVEAGHHEGVDSVRRHEAVLWLTLVNAGLLGAEDVPDLVRFRRLLAEASLGVPRIVEVRHRQRIGEGDGFRMEPGFRNFQAISKGQLLARNGGGPLFASEDGLILLPLYQGKGDDGFFIARKVHMFWLRCSTALRQLRLGGLIRTLPGVRRHADRAEVLIVDTRIARWYPLEIFHLLGFRKLRRTGTELLVSRRVHDLASPRRVSLPGPR